MKKSKSTSIPMKPLTTAHLRMLKLASKGPVVYVASAEPERVMPARHLPVKGAVAVSIIKSLQARKLIDRWGNITLAGKGALLVNAQVTSEACG